MPLQNPLNVERLLTSLGENGFTFGNLYFNEHSKIYAAHGPVLF